MQGKKIAITFVRCITNIRHTSQELDKYISDIDLLAKIKVSLLTSYKPLLLACEITYHALINL